MSRKQQPREEQSTAARIGVSIIVLLGLLIVSGIIALFFSSDIDDVGANTAIIRIIGPIMGDTSDGVFAESVTSSTDVIEQLERARTNPDITAVILEINSPGGSAVASDEIGQEIKLLRSEGKIVVAWIRESGASGAYWIASSSDHIVANRMSITGSIGVIGSYVEFAEFLDDWNLTYRRLVAGEQKDIGDPFVELDRTDRAFLQSKLNRVHTFFIEEVAANRNMSERDVAQLADGSFLLGIEAYEVGLVDELGGEAEAIAYIENATGTQVIATIYEDEQGWLADLLGLRSQQRLDVRDLSKLQSQEQFVPQLR